jgi:hypothetical protein
MSKRIPTSPDDLKPALKHGNEPIPLIYTLDWMGRDDELLQFQKHPDLLSLDLASAEQLLDDKARILCGTRNQLNACQDLLRKDRFLRTKNAEAASAKADFLSCKHAETLNRREVSALQERVDALEIRVRDPFPCALMGLAEVAVNYKVRDLQDLEDMSCKQLGVLFSDLVSRGILLNAQLRAATAALDQRELHYLCNELKILTESGGKYECRYEDGTSALRTSMIGRIAFLLQVPNFDYKPPVDYQINHAAPVQDAAIAL